MILQYFKHHEISSQKGQPSLRNGSPQLRSLISMFVPLDHFSTLLLNGE